MDTPNFGKTIPVFMEFKISKNMAGSVTKLQKKAVLPVFWEKSQKWAGEGSPSLQLRRHGGPRPAI